MPIRRDVRRAIEQLRLERDWSKAEVARRAGMTVAAFSRLVNGRTGDVALSTLERIAKGLGCTLVIHMAEKKAKHKRSH